MLAPHAVLSTAFKCFVLKVRPVWVPGCK